MTMSTITPTRPPTRWVPKRLARLTVDQYEAMVDSGVFTKRDRFTLINGFLVAKVPKSPRHTFIAKHLARNLKRLVPSGWDFRIEDAVRLPDSKPEPMFRGAGGHRRLRGSHPGPADLAMVVEVAASSVSEDRQMADVYGPAGIPVYWIVNLKARQVEVYSLLKRPGASGYGKPRVFKAGQSVPLVIEGVEVGRIAVTDILPPDPTGAAAPAVGGDGGLDQRGDGDLVHWRGKKRTLVNGERARLPRIASIFCNGPFSTSANSVTAFTPLRERSGRPTPGLQRTRADLARDYPRGPRRRQAECPAGWTICERGGGRSR